LLQSIVAAANGANNIVLYCVHFPH